MRGGYPVRIVHTTHCEKIAGYVDPDKLFPKDWKPVESYWHVTTKLVGDCGHKHATEAEAQGCLQPMIEKWRAARWPKKTAVHP